MARYTISPESVDHLGRVMPARIIDTAQSVYWTSRGVAELLAISAQNERRAGVCPGAYNAIVDAAAAVGITHYPPDLSGRTQPIRRGDGG